MTAVAKGYHQVVVLDATEKLIEQERKDRIDNGLIDLERAMGKTGGFASMDAGFPVMDGKESTMVNGKPDEPVCNISIIALTISVPEHTLRKRLDSGRIASVMGPFKCDKFIEVLARPHRA